jgi:hypothetical protein
MIDRSKKLQAYFYETPGGKEPVRNWIKELGPEDRDTVGKDIANVEFGWPIGIRALGGSQRHQRRAHRPAAICDPERAHGFAACGGRTGTGEKAHEGDRA